MFRWLTSLWARLRQSFGGEPDQLVDPEVREIFLSELDEVSDTLTALLPTWRAQRKHPTALQDIRRGFHTLKGSARMVGANELGDFCGRIEKLALDLIERPSAASPDAVATVEKAIGLLPDCARATRAGRPIPALQRVARSVRGD